MVGCLGLAFFVLSVPLHAKPYCSLIVRVVDYDGREINSDVTVTEKTGRTLQRENEPGGARFCDLGIGVVTVKVGGKTCGVTLNLPLAWTVTRIAKITYDPTPCLHDPAPPQTKSCNFLLRVFGPQKKPLLATFDQTSPRTQSFRTDEFGRVLIGVNLGSTVAGEVFASNFARQPITMTCSSEQSIEHEVILEKLSPNLQ
jgi:hypothetical protein